jgi:signal transduction histidine kinase
MNKLSSERFWYVGCLTPAGNKSGRQATLALQPALQVALFRVVEQFCLRAGRSQVLSRRMLMPSVQKDTTEDQQTAMWVERQNLERGPIQVTNRVAAAQLAHELAHEINNPLEALTNLIYIMKASAAELGECAVMLEEADHQLSRISRLVHDILTLDNAEPRTTD